MTSAYISGLAWYQILFWGTGVSAFIAHALYTAWMWRQSTTVFERLLFQNAYVTDIEVPSLDSKVISLGTRYKLHNAASVPVYYRLVRAAVSIDGKVRPDARVHDEIFMIQPDGDNFINAAVIDGLETKESLRGTVSFSVLYGDSRDALRYVLEHEGVLAISLIRSSDPNEPRKILHKCTMFHKKVSNSIRVLE